MTPGEKALEANIKRLKNNIAVEEQLLQDYPGQQSSEALNAAKATHMSFEQAFNGNKVTRMLEAWVGSGLHSRTSGNARLDYILMKLHDKAEKLSSNKVSDHPENPPKTNLTQSNQWSTTKPWVGAIPRDVPISQVGDFSHFIEKPNKNKRLFKVGSKTGNTTGFFKEMKSRVQLPWDISPNPGPGGPSTEIALLGIVPPFSDRGDSGAAVFDMFGNWVGMVMAGNTKEQAANNDKVTYITPALTILKDIEDRLNNGKHGPWKFSVYVPPAPPDPKAKGGK